MTTEMLILGWTLVLAVAQILLPSALRNKETGQAYNVSPRDTPGPPVGVVTARLRRAQANLFETLPLFIAAVLIVHVTARENWLSLWGAAIYLAARVVYVPLYAAGIPVFRTVVWMISMVGLLMVMWVCLAPAF